MEEYTVGKIAGMEVLHKAYQHGHTVTKADLSTPSLCVSSAYSKGYC